MEASKVHQMLQEELYNKQLVIHLLLVGLPTAPVTLSIGLLLPIWQYLVTSTSCILVSGSESTPPFTGIA